MYIYLIEQTEETGWDTYDSAVVVAMSAEDARLTQPNEGDEFGGVFSAWCSSPDKVTATLIGSAAPDMTLGVVLASFNAG